VPGTSHVFADAAGENHRFVVQAYDADGKAGTKSVPASWAKQEPLVAPAEVTAVQSGNDLSVSWSAVPNATGYLLRDAGDSSFSPATISGTSYTVTDAIYAPHQFEVAAVNGSETGPNATSASYTPAHQLSAGQQAMAYKMPTSLVKPGTCTADTADENSSIYVSAAVSCEPASGARHDGPQVLYALQLTPGDQNKYEQAHFGHMASRAGCESSFPASGTHGVWSVNGKTQGDEYCYANNGHNVFAWTYYRENIAIQIEGTSPTTRSGLHAWWQARSAELQ
jgi:hypothetical protein